MMSWLQTEARRTEGDTGTQVVGKANLRKTKKIDRHKRAEIRLEEKKMY